MLQFSDTLRPLVTKKFAQARASQALIFSETELAVLNSQLSGAAFQLRYCPALKHKPVQDSSNQEDEAAKKKFDPFEDPSPDLLIAQIPTHRPSHNLVLNKYPVIPNHFIIATRDDRPQDALLEEDDVYLTFQCLQAWKDTTNRIEHSLFAFFNSGEHSGASQKHRHLQFLPVEDITTKEGGWNILCDSMKSSVHEALPLLHNPKLPFVHYAVRLEAGLDSRAIYAKYLLLMRAALASINGGLDLDIINSVRIIDEERKTTFSYNLAMTTDVIAIMPRKAESAAISSSNERSIFVNGTVLAGTMMVREEDDWLQLRREPEFLSEVLDKIAFSVKTTHM